MARAGRRVSPDCEHCQSTSRGRGLIVNGLERDYLGILVELLQEWDRYTTSRNSVFTGELPISSADVCVGASNRVVHINYGNAEVARKSQVTWTSLCILDVPHRASRCPNPGQLVRGLIEQGPYRTFSLV